MALGILLAVGIGLALFHPRRISQDRAPQPSPSPPPAIRPSPLRTPLSLRGPALALRRAVLDALPDQARAEQLAEEVLGDDAVRWAWASYRIRLPSEANLKEVLGQLVHAAEQSGGVLVTSRPVGSAQVVEFGIEHRGRVLPVLRVRLVQEEKAQKMPSARVAIVLDDAGASLEELDRALGIGRPVALAILPGLPHSTELARRASEAGLEVLLHLPMEPEDPAKTHLMGPGGVYGEMSEEAIARVVRTNLDQLPGVVGVNNHMGSRGTADPRVLRAVMRVIKERGLFFVDSRTTPRSAAEPVARELGVPLAVRSVFLDHDPAPEAIRQQVRRLVDLARRQGIALAIGHINRPHTAEVLREMVPELEAEGVEIVPVRTVVRRP